MGSIALLATVLGRQKDALRAFLIAGILMLIFNPEWLSDLSFQLSFLATLGLIIFVPVIDRFIPGKGALLREDLVTTLSAQLLVWPLVPILPHLQYKKLSAVQTSQNLFEPPRWFSNRRRLIADLRLGSVEPCAA